MWSLLPALFSVAILAASSANGLVPQDFQSSTTPTARRQFLTSVTGAGFAFVANSIQPEMAYAAAAKTGQASPWTGDYDDPNHPGCLRQVKVVGAPQRPDGTKSKYPIVEIKGYDSDGEKCTDRPPSRGDIWTVAGQLRGNEANLDFSAKGGPKNLLAKYEDGGIVFPDGNKWTKVPGGTPSRRPKDMTTLKSD